jgi:hypothetical protein
VIHFTIALIQLAGLLADTLLWTALVPLAIVGVLVAGTLLVRRGRRR